MHKCICIKAEMCMSTDSTVGSMGVNSNECTYIESRCVATPEKGVVFYTRASPALGRGSPVATLKRETFL